MALMSSKKVSWRAIDIVTAAVLGVALGFVFFAWNLIYQPLTAPLEALVPGLGALLYGVWLLAATMAAAIIRKPGAALFAELVAASVSALLGASWGILTLESALVQGLGAEIVLLVFAYRIFKPWVIVLAGAGAGLAMGINDIFIWYPGAKAEFIAIYVGSALISGAVIAGLGGWLLAKAIAQTGVLSRFQIGQEAAKPV